MNPTQDRIDAYRSFDIESAVIGLAIGAASAFGACLIAVFWWCL